MIGLIRLCNNCCYSFHAHRAFNLSVVISLKTNSDNGLPDDILNKIQSAMHVLVNRHGALRVTFCSHPTDKTVALSLPQATSHLHVKSSSIQVAQKLNNPNELNICTFKSDSELIHCSSCGQQGIFVGAGQKRCDTCALCEEIFKPFDMSKQLFRCAVFTPSKGKIILCLVFHHLITDGMSLFILTNELLALLKEDSSPTVHTVVTNSPDLSSNLQLTQADLVSKRRSIEKWVVLLSSADSCTNLSINQCGQQLSNTAHSHTAEDVFLELSDKSSGSISRLSQVYRVSPAVVIATMYSLTLHHFTGERDIIIGMVSANRSRAMEDTVGYFANTLPLRVNLNSLHANDLQLLMKQVRKNWGMILAGGIDLTDLVPLVPCLQHKSSGRESSSHSSPLQVLFSFYDVGEGKSLPNKFTVSGVEVNCEIKVPKPGHTHADLWMEANPNYVNGNGKSVFHWEYRRSALTHSMVEYLHVVLCRYLEAAADAITQGTAPSNPLELSIPTSDLNLSQVEGSKVFTSKTEIQNRHTSHLCYIQRFEQKCRECPHSPVFRIDSDSAYTYNDVQNMVSVIALFLIKTHNVRPGDRVALLLPRDPYLYLVVLAILKCGAAYVPVSADTAQQGNEGRLLKIFKVATTKLFLTVTSMWTSLVPRNIADSIVYLDEILANLSHLTDSGLSNTDLTILADLETRYSPDLLFYILFTSGTTGEPKAVGITNANLNTTFDNFLQLLSPEETKLTLAATGINFDSHILDSFAPLLNGACIVVAKSALDLADTLQEGHHDFDDSGVNFNTSTSSSSSFSYYDGITFTFATPSTTSVVDFPNSMKAIMVGGEVFTKACYQRTKHIPRVLNIYGPTECSVFMTAIEVPKLPLSGDSSLTIEEISRIGWPLPNVKVLIMNEAKHVVPIGRVGELHIAGPIVSSTGYLNIVEKSCKRSFFPNPASPEEMVYATGDLMYMLPNRMLQFVGRKDGQAKLRGMRIHLQEVTNALSSHPAVQFATSLVINPSTPSATLVSFVTPKKIDKSSLLEHLRHCLPSYMVPSLIITDDELIRYKLSKDYIQSRALKAIEEASYKQDNYPKDPLILTMASKIATLFGKVLDVRDYPITGDFFAFGGHSLLCFHLLKEINQEMQVRLSLTHIMQNSNPLALTGVVVELKNKREPLELLCVSHSNSQANTHIHQPSPHQNLSYNVKKDQDDAKAPMRIKDKFDYLEPAPAFPLSAGLEAKLTQLFKENKNRSTTSREDVEFQTISDSLAQETGFYIPPHSLVHYDSMEALQAHLKLKTILSFTSNPQRVVITLQPPTSSEDKPIFFVHSGVIGWSLSYAKLAKQLGTYSVAIQRTPDAPVSSFEEMTAFYLKHLRSMQPKAPYKLVGVCYGACVVYELMRQLIEEGEMVDIAVLINNSPVNENRPTIFNQEGLPLPNTMAHPLYFYESTLKLNLKNNKSIEEHNGVDVNLTKLTSDILEAYPWLPFSVSELAKAYEEFIKTLKPAWCGYIPKSIENMELVGRVMLIRNKEHPFFTSHDYGLLGLLNGLSVVVSPRKLGLLNDEDTVQFISDKISEYLAP